jgi:hypothetical protein
MTRRVLAALLLVTGALAGCGDRGSAGAAPAPAAPAAGEAQRCGGSGEPDCPLQVWMRATLQAYLTGTDARRMERIAGAFDKLAAAAPQEHPQWADMASRGARAARGQDLAGVRRACVECHDAYRERFRAGNRARSLF